jgi:hypothetical protein
MTWSLSTACTQKRGSSRSPWAPPSCVDCHQLRESYLIY